MIGHVIFLSHFCHRLHLYSLLHHCHVCLSWYTACCPIGHASSVPILTSIAPVQSITLSSCLDFIIDCTLSDWLWLFNFFSTYDQSRYCPFLIHHKLYTIRLVDNLISYSVEITHVWSVMSYMVFMIGYILSNHSWQFDSDFDVNHTYMASHVVVLFGLSHSLYPVGSIITIQFRFRWKVNLYNCSRHCPVSSSSLTAHCPIGLEILVLYLVEITLVWSITSLSCLLFVIDQPHPIRSVIIVQF